MGRWIWICCFAAALSAKPLDVKVTARSAILINAETGAVLYEKEAHTPSYPASITKVGTALYVMEEKKADLSEIVTVSAEALRTRSKADPNQPSHRLTLDGTKMGLVKGEKVALEALLYGLMLASGNDAANAIAESQSGSVPRFVEELNGFFEKIGCAKTHFCNPHGLHHPEHVTTAYDMSLMARRALKYPTFRKILSALSYRKEETNKQPPVEIKQSTQIAVPHKKHYYPKAIGGKTGYTCPAGNTLVAVAEHEGRTLIAVLLGCEKNDDRYIDARKLFETAFAEQTVRSILVSKGQGYMRTMEGAKSPLCGVLADDAAVEFFPAEEPDVKAYIHWESIPLPIRKGQKVGEVRIMDARSIVLAAVPLIAKEEVSGAFFFTLKQKWKRLFGQAN